MPSDEPTETDAHPSASSAPPVAHRAVTRRTVSRTANRHTVARGAGARSTVPRSAGAPSGLDRVFTGVVIGVAFTVGAMAYLAQRLFSQFFADDFLYLQLARAGSFTPEWLAVNSYGHFAPGNRFLYLAVQRTVGLDYQAAALVPSVLVVTIFLSLTWFVRELAGGRIVPIAVGLLGATSVPIMSTMLWFGAGNHVLGGAATMTLCVTAFVVYMLRGQERYRVVSVLALAAGLLHQERPMITIGYLVLIRYLFPIRPVDALTPARWLLREIWFWLPWVVVETTYLIYRLFIFEGAPQPGNASDAAEFIGLSVLRGWAPSLVGVRLSPVSPLLTMPVVLGLLLFTTVSVVLVLRRLQAWRALAFLAAIYLANMGIVAVGRLSVTDLRALATDLQYYVDVHIGTILAFVLGFTLLPARSPRARRRRSPTTPFRFGVLAAALALLASTAVTAHAVLVNNYQTYSHGYLNRAQSDLHAHPGPYALMRTKLPTLVAPSFIDPYTDVPAVFSLDHDVADHLDPTSDNRLVVLSSGEVTTAHPSTVAVVDAPSQRVSAGLGTFKETSGGACLSGPAGSYFKVKMPRQVDGVGVFFAVTYSSEADHRLLASTKGGGRATNWIPTELPAGSGVTVVDRLEGTSVRRLDLAFSDDLDTDVCLTRVWIGRIAAEVDGQCQGLGDHAEVVGPALSCTGGWDDDIADPGQPPR